MSNSTPWSTPGVSIPRWVVLLPLSKTGLVLGQNISDNVSLWQPFVNIVWATCWMESRFPFDQEKAYDRVHPEYLRTVMEKVQFHRSLIDSIFTLLFGTQIHLNINDRLTSPFPKRRELQQGDPLSPYLCSITFKSLLRTILKCLGISDFCLSNHSTAKPLKLIAFADDLAILLW